jgi:hypothetical protein
MGKEPEVNKDPDKGVWVGKPRYGIKKGGYLPPGYEEKSDEPLVTSGFANSDKNRMYEEALFIFNLHEDVVGELNFEHPFIDKIKNAVAESTASGERMNVYISSDHEDFDPSDVFKVASLDTNRDLLIGKKSKTLLANVLEKRGVKRVTIVGCCITKKDAKSYVPKGIKVLSIDIDKKV